MEYGKGSPIKARSNPAENEFIFKKPRFDHTVFVLSCYLLYFIWHLFKVYYYLLVVAFALACSVVPRMQYRLARMLEVVVEYEVKVVINPAVFSHHECRRVEVEVESPATVKSPAFTKSF